jgi:hypothetical protein
MAVARSTSGSEVAGGLLGSYQLVVLALLVGGAHRRRRHGPFGRRLLGVAEQVLALDDVVHRLAGEGGAHGDDEKVEDPEVLLEVDLHLVS